MVVFKTKMAYKLVLLYPEIMKVLGSAKKDVDKNKDGEHAPNWHQLKLF